jgi:hypothetical protein
MLVGKRRRRLMSQDKSVFSLYTGHIVRHIFEGWVSYKFKFYKLIKRNYFILNQGHLWLFRDSAPNRHRRNLNQESCTQLIYSYVFVILWTLKKNISVIMGFKLLRSGAAAHPTHRCRLALFFM